jgi:ubiquitin C-terminal hydrolase
VNPSDDILLMASSYEASDASPANAKHIIVPIVRHLTIHISNPVDMLNQSYMLHLKRWRFGVNNIIHKNNHSIEGILDSITIPIIGPDNKKYRLYLEPDAIICHSGTRTCGHYWSYKKVGDFYYKKNDAQTNFVTADSLKNNESFKKQVYLMQYKIISVEAID